MPSRPRPLEWEYAPAPEAREIVQIRERYGLFIGGEEVEPQTGEWFPSISPSTEETLFEVALAGEADVELAVGAARNAFEHGWSELAPSERRSISSESLVSSRSARASSPLPSRSTEESRSASHAT